jgi:endonuclease YncB( thermonuclease family)
MAIMNLEATPSAEQIVISSIPTIPTKYPATDTPTSVSTATPQPTEIIVELPAKEIAFVRRIIDGDTIEVILDGKPYRLRYIGLDTPEIGMPYSTEATEANRNLVEEQIVELERDISETDQYGRLLRYVYLQDGTLVNAELVESGFALALAYPPDIKYQDLINLSEQSAKENMLGLWAPPLATATIAPEESVFQILVDPLCSQFNAPGNDNENKNEEYVCIASNGSGPIDMSAWSMNDQYGWTYLFPAYTLEAGSKVNIRTGCGDDSQLDLYWCKDETAVWNNDGDCVYLSNPEGQVITEYCY